jgi:uncharacterized protein
MFRWKRSRPLPWVGLSLMPEPEFLQVTQPLFEAGDVEAIEWSFDVGWGMNPLPNWVEQLVDFYSQRDRLLGHGVSYSLLSAQWSERQTQWLKLLELEGQRYRYRYISEHFGWMSAGNFDRSAPLPMPLTPDTLRLGRDRLLKLADKTSVAIGLENLAFAFGLQDVLTQGEFIEQLLETVNGFLVLDLHNIFCQVHNFGISAEKLLNLYPLHRVRELHISGGSWSQCDRNSSVRIRRDTHDGDVPEEVFELLAIALKKCPTVEAIVFERLGNTLDSEAKIARFRQDFYRIKQIVSKS